MPRAQTSSGVVSLLWAICLLAPPVCQFVVKHGAPDRAVGSASAGVVAGGSGPDGASAGGLGAMDPTWEVALAAQELLELRHELRALGVRFPRERYEAVPADVLPAGDPSPKRSAWWLGVRGRDVAEDTAVVTGEGALAGRVVRALPAAPTAGASGQDTSSSPGGADVGAFGLVRVQSLLDPGFRVRCRIGDSLGLLCGTGKRATDGQPLLEVLLLDTDRVLGADEKVFTAGDDGIYPAGLPVGVVVGDDPEADAWVLHRRSHHRLVRAVAAVDGERSLVLLADRMTARLREELRPRLAATEGDS